MYGIGSPDVSLLYMDMDMDIHCGSKKRANFGGL